MSSDANGTADAPAGRREDPPLLTGDAEFADDVRYPGMAHLVIARSQHAHARIEGIDTSAAEELDGVLAVYTAADVDAAGVPGLLGTKRPEYATVPDRPMLARDRVRYHGDPVAAVVAEDRYIAHEARDLIEVEYDRLDAALDPAEAASADAPTLHDEVPDNVAFEWEAGDEAATDEAFAAADRAVGLDLENRRLIPTPMEPRAAVARYTPSTGELVVDLPTQWPHEHGHDLAETLGLPDHKVRVRAPAIGGGFGCKIHRYAGEALTAFAATRLGRPVAWRATRSEAHLADAHGRGHRTRAELAVDDDGTIRGLRAETDADLGAYVSTLGAVIPVMYGMMLPGQYDIPAVHGRVHGVFTNRTPTDAYRGAGRPEATYLVERLADHAARELGMDPVEFRRRNLVPADAFPYRSATGYVYDSGDYDRALGKALDLAGYGDFRERQARAREEGRYLGLGISSFVEVCAPGPDRPESARVRFKPSGHVVATAGAVEIGQGIGTTYARIVADALGVPESDVAFDAGDTAMGPEGRGTSGSRGVAVAGSALVRSAEKVVEKARRIAAAELEADADDLEFEDGTFGVRGAPGRSIAIREVARRAYGGGLPDGVEPGLEATAFYTPENYTFPFGAHVAVVEVDPETGEVAFERYVAVDDVGERIDPGIVEGQVHGGVAQGIGQALFEAAEYDDNGQLLSGSLQDYAIPKAEHVPEMDLDHTVTPCPHNPLGAKGVGEAGTIAAPPAVVNAVVDALEPLGVDNVDMPLTGERVWRAIEDAG